VLALLAAAGVLTALTCSAALRSQVRTAVVVSSLVTGQRMLSLYRTWCAIDVSKDLDLCLCNHANSVTIEEVITPRGDASQRQARIASPEVAQRLTGG